MVKNNSEEQDTFTAGSSGWILNNSLVEKVRNSLEDLSVIHGIIEHMIEGIVILDGELKVFEANSSFCRMLGYSHDEILNLHVWDWDPRIAPDTNRKLSMTLLDNTRVHFESKQKRKDGSLNTVEIQGQTFGYKDGIWQICLCRDINDLKKVESDLKKFQIDLNETQKIAHIGSWELDLENDVLVCSSEMKKIWGIPQDKQTHGMGSLKISVVPEDQSRLDQTIQNSIQNAIPYDIEYRIIDRQGNIKHLHSRSKVTKDSKGKAIRLYGMCQDITERKKHEEERKLNEIRLLQSQEIAHIGTYEYNLKTNELWWSDELYKIYGFKADKVIDPEDYINSIHPDDSDRLKAMMANEKEDYHIEYRIIRPDGEIRYLSNFIGKHEYRDGERYLIRGTSQDITEQKLIEREKNQLESKLHHAQKMETIGTLAGGVAHDINNILGIIIGNTELCMDDVPEWNPAYSNLNEIVKAVLRAKEVIRQLLTFSRNMEVKKETIDIVSVINDALKFLRSTISATIEIEKKIEASRPNIIADPTQIDQIIMNICANSAQAMEEVGGKIKVSVENITIDHTHEDDSDALADGEYIKIVISDNGPGIPAELHEKIFDPYFTTKEIGKGSGMGLAVVQGIVNKHKGSINVKSEPGEGTTFTILLPGIKEDDKKVDPDISISSDGKRLLFIDDEEQITKIASRMLEGMGFKVDQETNPQKALELFKENPANYDLVITDMAMPQMNALMLFKEIRDIRPDIPVILSSGHNPLIDEVKAKETGFSAYILKPFTKAELSTAVKNAFE